MVKDPASRRKTHAGYYFFVENSCRDFLWVDWRVLRQRLAFEGNFFKNLNISTGLEVRYHTPYKADNYAPVLGQFFYQDTATINNRPEINAFLHFRIRSFKGFIRVENLNTFKVGDKGVQFTNNNLATPNYAYPGLVTRFGIYWSFVN